MVPCIRLWPAMVHLFTPPHRNEKPEPANVWKKVFAIASTTVSITSLTVISVGIPIVTIITLDMTYTRSLHLTLKVIFPFFLFYVHLLIHS